MLYAKIMAQASKKPLHLPTSVSAECTGRQTLGLQLSSVEESDRTLRETRDEHNLHLYICERAFVRWLRDMIITMVWKTCIDYMLSAMINNIQTATVFFSSTHSWLLLYFAGKNTWSKEHPFTWHHHSLVGTTGVEHVCLTPPLAWNQHAVVK